MKDVKLHSFIYPGITFNYVIGGIYGKNTGNYISYELCIRGILNFIDVLSIYISRGKFLTTSNGILSVMGLTKFQILSESHVFVYNSDRNAISNQLVKIQSHCNWEDSYTSL